MKTEASPRRLGEGVKVIFDQEAPSSRGSARSRSSSSSTSDSSYSSSRVSRSSRGSSRHRRRSRSSSSSDSSSSSRSRSRSHPRCHRASGHSRCHHRHHSPPRHYRARSRSFSPSPERSSRYRRYHRRSRSRSPSPYRYSRRYRRSPSRSRSRTRSPMYWRGSRFVGRYRCRFSTSPRNSRPHRSRSRSRERGAIRLSQEEKKYLLNIAKANATRILGVQNIELPASLKELDEEEKRRSSSVKEERVRTDPVPQKTPAQVNVVTNDDEAGTSVTSPKRKPISFSVTNAVARPSNSPTFHESKVTSRADSVADRKPYGHWVSISKSSPKNNKH
ncbi:arginine/serine-rich protein 1 [Myxocyprinus asiaticus]|uniref:arginine/serine-rich protein 1 n=1 Tax=Myxocyprinus asiaticus TaxID=70543 RepID=UPI0022225AD4|nr:arginine/serine-rich protein 1 [Myxocyprinus asiaticus]